MARSERKQEVEEAEELEIVEIPNPYPVPLYLNQKYVFSVLAMMEGGYAQLETVKANRSAQEEHTSKISGEVGVSNVFALLSMKLGGERGSQKQSGDTEERSSERVHTPDSLFARLRERLYQDGLIRTENLADAQLGEYVEFAASLHKNPLIEVLETYRSFGEISKAVEKASAPNSGSQQGQHGSRQKNHQQQGSGQKQNTPQSTQSTTNQVLAQIEVLLQSLSGKEGGTFDLVGEVNSTEDGPRLKVVLVLDPSFANDPTSADLIDGEYYVLGKVVKAVPKDSDEKISLLRKTSLGKAGPLVAKLADSLASMDTEETGIALPKKIETELAGPVIQVVPIAIFM